MEPRQSAEEPPVVVLTRLEPEITITTLVDAPLRVVPVAVVEVLGLNLIQQHG